MDLVLLPGLDGTGELFRSFVAKAPSRHPPRVIPLPKDGSQEYEALVERLAPCVGDGPCVLLGESFSGPLSILLARRLSNVRGLILCVTFARAPLPPWAGMLARKFLFREPKREPPEWMMELILTGGDRALTGRVREANRFVSGEAVYRRIEVVCRIDVRRELEELSIPILSLRATRDRLVPAFRTRETAELNSRVRLADVDAPHVLLEGNPVGAWREIEGFLDECGERN